MKEMRNILGWLGMAEEQDVIRDCSKHIDEICNTVSFFAEAMKAYLNGDLSAKTTAIENVRASEHAADIIRRAITKKLSEGMLLPPDRETLMKFTKNMDKIADGTNAAARLLSFIEHKPNDAILRNLSIATDLIVKGSSNLRDAIQAMNRNDAGKMMSHCEEVERIEHDADDQKRVLLESVIRAKLDATSVLLLFNLAETLESVTDRIDDVTEQVRQLVVKSR